MQSPCSSCQSGNNLLLWVKSLLSPGLYIHSNRLPFPRPTGRSCLHTRRLRANADLITWLTQLAKTAYDDFIATNSEGLPFI